MDRNEIAREWNQGSDDGRDDDQGDDTDGDARVFRRAIGAFILEWAGPEEAPIAGFTVIGPDGDRRAFGTQRQALEFATDRLIEAHAALLERMLSERIADVKDAGFMDELALRLSRALAAWDVDPGLTAF